MAKKVKTSKDLIVSPFMKLKINFNKIIIHDIIKFKKKIMKKK